MKLIRPLMCGDKIKVKPFLDLLYETQIEYDTNLLDYTGEWLTVTASHLKNKQVEYATAELAFMIPAKSVNTKATNWWLFKQSFKRGS